MNEAIQTLQEAVRNAKTVVFFGGAGVSTESGIPDFRSVDGLYHQHYDYPPETILSHSFFLRHTEEFYRFYRDKLLVDAEPNAAHRALAAWEQAGKLNAVITQNIDGLHQKAGSKKVLELHGSVLRNTCMQCGKKYDVTAITESKGIPCCEHCGGRIKPDVVLYEESLDNDVMDEAIRCIREADMMIIGGTSLAVYPAAGLIHYFKGDVLALVNRDATPFDAHADLVLHEKIGAVFSQL